MSAERPVTEASAGASFAVVLGIAQDGGAPQAGAHDHPGWTDPAFVRHAACLGLVDPAAGARWMIDATTDFRTQLHALGAHARAAPEAGPLDGIVLTHAHVGHYTGLVHLGRECMNARGVHLYAMPRMRAFLERNGPWEALVREGNVTLHHLEAGREVRLSEGLALTPLPVTHRTSYSETVGFVIRGRSRTVLYVPDTDGWEAWERDGTRVETLIAAADVAYLDGTFYDAAELPGRSRVEIPHPTIAGSMDRFAALSARERAKVRFVHLNHSNPALREDSDAAARVTARGFAVAREGEVVVL